MIQQGIDITAVIAEDKLQHIVFMEQSEIKVYPAFVIIHKAGLSGYIFDDSAAVYPLIKNGYKAVLLVFC